MPENDDNNQSQQTDMAQISRTDLQNLRAIAKAHEKMQADYANLQREVTISKAGLNDLGEIQRKALLAVVGDQELTPEVLSETAKALGFVQPPAPAPSPQDLATQQFTQQMQPANTTPPFQPPVDPLAQYRQATNTAPQTGTPPRDFASDIASADSPEAVMALVNQLGIQAHYD